MNLEPTYLLTGEILTDKVYDEILMVVPEKRSRPWRRYFRSISRLY